MGRPVQYTEEERKDIKKSENQHYYKERRKSLIAVQRKNNLKIKKDFIDGLCKLKVCDFSHFVTLTFDPKKLSKTNLIQQLQDAEIRKLLVFFPEMEKYLMEKKYHRQSIEFVQNVGNAFFNFLLNRNIMSNILTAIEKDKSGRWHIHALISSENLSINETVQSSWRYGKADVKEIGMCDKYKCCSLVEQREKIIAYMYKTFNPTATSNVEQKRLDYWYLHQFEVKDNLNVLKNRVSISGELELINNYFNGRTSINSYVDQGKATKEFFINNTNSLIEYFKISPVALFCFLTILLMLI